MQKNIKIFTSILISFIIVTLVIFLVVVGQRYDKVEHPPTPDFSQFAAGAERKHAFFEYFTILIEHNNQQILDSRLKLINYHNNMDNLWWFQNEEVVKIASQYDLPFFDIQQVKDWQALLSRVDIVPISLALAQAANESAWGTSRFAELGNNYYGQWCYKLGCGLVPNDRDQGKVHEVAKFNSALQSVEKYMHNINTHDAYAELRLMREQLRKANKPISGLVLANALGRYSERGQEYIKEIKAMIKYNKLAQYDL